jgi:hypothetical protein
MVQLRIERFDSPAETRTFEKGRFELIEVGGHDHRPRDL